MRDINPINNNGSIQLKFSYAGKRYSFNPIPGGVFSNRREFNTARAIACQIQNDILAQNFDPTLDRYRISPKLILKALATPKTLLELWDMWVDSLNLTPATKQHHYKTIRNQIVKSNPSLTDTSWLSNADLSPSTFNQRLGYLKACFKWAISKHVISDNPYNDVKTHKIRSKLIKPFNSKEIQLIIEGFDKYAPHYSPFIKFLFATGVRTSEGIGLLWRDVDFDRGIVHIQESLSRDWDGNGYKRARKETKTGSEHQFLMNSTLREVKPSEPVAEALVFTTVTGKAIDDGNFRERYWCKVLEYQNIEYRNPYCIRHTTASHAIEQGISVIGVAYLLGHKDSRMVIQTYGHMINRPELPTIF